MTPPKATTALPPARQTPGASDEAANSARDAFSVTLAVAIGAHGVGGEVRLKVFAHDLGAHRVFNGGALTMTSLRGGSAGSIARFAEVADRTAAEMLRGTALTVPRAALPPLSDGEYYHADLIGLPVTSTEGVPLGRVVAVENFGAGDVVEIERPAAGGAPGKRFMVPMRPEAVPQWSSAGMTVHPAWAE